MYSGVCLCSKPFTFKLSMSKTKLLTSPPPAHTPSSSEYELRVLVSPRLCGPAPNPTLHLRFYFCPYSPPTLLLPLPCSLHSSHAVFLADLQGACGLFCLTDGLSPQISTWLTTSPLPVSGQCRFISEAFPAHLQDHGTTPFPPYTTSLLSFLYFTCLFVPVSFCSRL